MSTTTRHAARKRRSKIIGTANGSHLNAALLAIVMLTTVLVMLAHAAPPQAVSPDEVLPNRHGPMAFEKDGDIRVATRMHLANPTPDTVSTTEVNPTVSLDGRHVAFASDRDGDFEVYVAGVFTGEAVRVTDNAANDRSPAWSPDGQRVSYRLPHYASPTHLGMFSANVVLSLRLKRAEGRR